MKDKCTHPGCHNHVTHPCEGCGKTAGQVLRENIERNVVQPLIERMKEFNDRIEEKEK